MSELTPCNFCTLQSMQRRGIRRGVIVIVEQITDPDDEMHGWISARYSDQEEPSAYFAELTESCVC